MSVILQGLNDRAARGSLDIIAQRLLTEVPVRMPWVRAGIQLCPLVQQAMPQASRRHNGRSGGRVTACRTTNTPPSDQVEPLAPRDKGLVRSAVSTCPSRP